MDFLVVGRDRPGFLAGSNEARLDELNDDHWSYMEGYASLLVARGPILSADGTEHLGSVHVVAARDRDEANTFAFDEPYWRAGLYATVEVVGFENVLQSTMWELERDIDIDTSWFVTWRWPSPTSFRRDSWSPGVVAGLGARRLVFAGFLLDDTGASTQGFVAGLDGSAGEIPQLLSIVSDHFGLRVVADVQRWRRGGRPSTAT